jgi:hypothetical protein
MNKQLPLAALSALSWMVGQDATAHGRFLFTASATRCNACHTGGAPPMATFTADENATHEGSRLRIVAGQPAALTLDVNTLPNKGLGLAITTADGLTLEAVGNDTRVERRILGHRRVLFEITGLYHVPFVVTASPASCGRTFSLIANVTAVDRNDAPSGDGTATRATPVFVDCAPAAKTVQSAEPPKVAIQSGIKPAEAPTAPAIGAPSTAARVMAPTGTITAPVKVSVDALRAPGGVAQLELSNVDRIDASRGAEAEFLEAGGERAGLVSLRFNQSAGHIVVDCELRSPVGVIFAIDAGTVHIENRVPVSDGHAVTVVPRGGIQRDVQVTLRGAGRPWRFRGCELTPVR